MILVSSIKLFSMSVNLAVSIPILINTKIITDKVAMMTMVFVKMRIARTNSKVIQKIYHKQNKCSRGPTSGFLRGTGVLIPETTKKPRVGAVVKRREGLGGIFGYIVRADVTKVINRFAVMLDNLKSETVKIINPTLENNRFYPFNLFKANFPSPCSYTIFYYKVLTFVTTFDIIISTEVTA